MLVIDACSPERSRHHGVFPSDAVADGISPGAAPDKTPTFQDARTNFADIWPDQDAALPVANGTSGANAGLSGAAQILSDAAAQFDEMRRLSAQRTLSRSHLLESGRSHPTEMQSAVWGEPELVAEQAALCMMERPEAATRVPVDAWAQVAGLQYAQTKQHIGNMDYSSWQAQQRACVAEANLAAALAAREAMQRAKDSAVARADSLAARFRELEEELKRERAARREEAQRRERQGLTGVHLQERTSAVASEAAVGTPSTGHLGRSDGREALRAEREARQALEAQLAAAEAQLTRLRMQRAADETRQAELEAELDEVARRARQLAHAQETPVHCLRMHVDESPVQEVKRADAAGFDGTPPDHLDDRMPAQALVVSTSAVGTQTHGIADLSSAVAEAREATAEALLGAISAHLGASCLARQGRMHALRRWQRATAQGRRTRRWRQALAFEACGAQRMARRLGWLREAFTRLLGAQSTPLAARRAFVCRRIRTLARGFRAVRMAVRGRHSHGQRMDRTSACMQGWRLSLAVRTWAGHAIHTHSTRQRRVRSLACLCGLRTRRAFYGWRGHGRRLRQCLAVTAIVHRSTGVLRGARARAAVDRWVALASGDRRRVARLDRALAASRSNLSRRGWRAWRAAHAARRREWHAMAATARRQEARAWRLWTARMAATTRSAWLCGWARGALQRGQRQRGVGQALRTWRRAVDAWRVRRVLHPLLRRCRGAQTHWGMMWALGEWRVARSRSARARRQLEAAAVHWSTHGCARAWEQWCALHGSQSAVRAAVATLLRCILQRSFSEWLRRISSRHCVQRAVGEARPEMHGPHEAPQEQPTEAAQASIMRTPAPMRSQHTTSSGGRDWMVRTTPHDLPSSTPVPLQALPSRTPPRTAPVARWARLLPTDEPDDDVDDAEPAHPAAAKPRLRRAMTSASLLRHTHASRGWENSSCRSALASQLRPVPFRRAGTGGVFGAPSAMSATPKADEALQGGRSRWTMLSHAAAVTSSRSMLKAALGRPNESSDAMGPSPASEAPADALAFAPQADPSRTKRSHRPD